MPLFLSLAVRFILHDKHNRILLALALLGNLDFLDSQPAAFDQLTTKGRRLLRGDVNFCGDVSGNCSAVGGQVINNGGLDRLVLKLGLGGLGTALLIALVQLGKSFCGMGLDFISHRAVDDCSVKFAVSHGFFLSALLRFSVGHYPFYLEVSSCLTF